MRGSRDRRSAVDARSGGLRSVVAVGAVAVLLGGACDASPSPTSSDTTDASTTTSAATTTTEGGAPERRVFSTPVIELGPEFDPDAATMSAINAALDEFEIWMLWPDGPPPGAASVPMAGRFSITRVVPGGTRVGFWMAPPDWSVAWESGDPSGEVCPESYAPLIVRGNAGCIDHLETGQLRLEWTERGRNMAVEAWELDEGTLLSWLATWHDLPNP